MKLKLTFKTPDVVSDAIKSLVEWEMRDRFGPHDGAYLDEEERVREDLQDTAERAASQWVTSGEYVTIEIDTDKGTAEVLPSLERPAKATVSTGATETGRFSSTQPNASNVPQVKIQKAEFLVIEDYELDRLVKQTYGRYFCSAAALELSRGAYYRLEISSQDLANWFEYDQKIWAAFIGGGIMEPPSVQMVLGVLCADGKIPEGTYLIYLT